MVALLFTTFTFYSQLYNGCLLRQFPKQDFLITVKKRLLATPAKAFWPTAAMGEADSVSSVSASACHISGPKGSLVVDLPVGKSMICFARFAKNRKIVENSGFSFSNQIWPFKLWISKVDAESAVRTVIVTRVNAKTGSALRMSQRGNAAHTRTRSVLTH